LKKPRSSPAAGPRRISSSAS